MELKVRKSKNLPAIYHVRNNKETETETWKNGNGLRFKKVLIMVETRLRYSMAVKHLKMLNLPVIVKPRSYPVMAVRCPKAIKLPTNMDPYSCPGMDPVCQKVTKKKIML